MARINYRGIRAMPDCKLHVGQGSIVEGNIVFERPGANVEIGKNTFVGNSTLVVAKSVVIGDDVLVAWGCFFVDHDSHSISWKLRSNDVTEWRAGRKDWAHVPSQ